MGISVSRLAATMRSGRGELFVQCAGMCLFSESSDNTPLLGSAYLSIVPKTIPLSIDFSKEAQLWASDYSKVTKTCWIRNKSSLFRPVLILRQKASRRCRRGDDVQHTGCTNRANKVSLVSQGAPESLEALTDSPVLEFISAVRSPLMVSILWDIIWHNNPKQLYQCLPCSLSWHSPRFLCQASSKIVHWRLNRHQCHFFCPREMLPMPYSCNNSFICHTDQPLQRCSNNTQPSHPSWLTTMVSHSFFLITPLEFLLWLTCFSRWMVSAPEGQYVYLPALQQHEGLPAEFPSASRMFPLAADSPTNSTANHQSRLPGSKIADWSFNHPPSPMTSCSASSESWCMILGPKPYCPTAPTGTHSTSFLPRQAANNQVESEETWDSSGESVYSRPEKVEAGVRSHLIGIRSIEPNWTLKETSSPLKTTLHFISPMWA